jgi:hypothetical protein
VLRSAEQGRRVELAPAGANVGVEA